MNLGLNKFLGLESVTFVSSMRRNLISVSRLACSGYSFNFNKNGFDLFQYYKLVGNGLVDDGLYKLNIVQPNFSLIIESEIVSKEKNEKSYVLWHKCLGHISKEGLNN